MSARPGAGGSAMAAVLAGAVLGPALQLQQRELWETAAYLVAFAAGALLLAAGCLAHRPLRLAGVLLGAALAAGSATGLRAQAFLADALESSLEGRDIAVVGLVAAMPHRNEAGIRFAFSVESARLAGAAARLPPRILLGWYGGADSAGSRGGPSPRQPADLRPGERWELTVRLKAPHGHANPHGFDYELWLWEQGVQATGYVRAGPRDPPPRRVASTWREPVERARHAVRDAIHAQVEDPRLAGILAALVVGDQGAIERVDWDVFRATGVAHLMSISGLHVTMFAWAAAWSIGFLWRRSSRLCLAWPAQHAGLAGGLLLAVAYAVFSGWGVPAQRTVWMLAAVALLRLLAREWPWPWLWLFACATVVTLDPWALTQAGFWLSFVAVGVLFASGSPAAPGLVEEGGSRPRRAARAAAALVREQWVVTLALTPLSLLLFGQASVVGLLANLLAIPWVTLLVTPLALAGVLLAPLWNLAALAVSMLGWVLQALAQLPFATWSAPAPAGWAAAAGVAGGLLLAMRLPWALRLLGVPLLLPVLMWQAPRPAAGEFELLAADVGQGNAVLVRTSGHTLVYDAGPGYSRDTDAGQRVLVPLLRAWGERVDTLVLSHRDHDHTGGAAAVLRMQADARHLGSLEASHPLHALRPGTRCERGQRWRWDGVDFEILHPASAAYQGRAVKPNAISCVLRVRNGRAAVLLAGDIERAQEALLVHETTDLRADVLLVPHHGSKTSSSGAFLAAVAPRIALVQAGYRNRFGHPAAEVRDRYHARGVALVTSFRCGAAHWQSVRPADVRCEREAARRYWHHRFAGAGE